MNAPSNGVGRDAATNQPTQTVGAVDLGSNSFHLLVAHYDGHRVKVVDQRKEMVRLAGGLGEDRQISQEAQLRALSALERFGQALRGVGASNVRAVGTNTLRAASNAPEFLERCRSALGHPIEVISGIEEARLVYVGVSHSLQPTDDLQLVIDIGGGSTECILGRRFEPEQCHSLRMGCVTFTEAFFADGRIKRGRLQAAMFSAKNELQTIAAPFRQLGWSRAIGSSGTFAAVADVLRLQGWSDDGITKDGLKALRERVLELGQIKKLRFEGLSERRQPVFIGGLAIVLSIFEALKLESLSISQAALREGVVYDLVGRFEGHDLRDSSVRFMQERYKVDMAQAERVTVRLRHLYDQVRESWKLSDEPLWRMLRWAAALHEVGLSVAYHGHHRHGAYLIENSDLAGFSKNEQQTVARLVLNHRRKLRLEELGPLANGIENAVRPAVLLRLAVLLERGRGATFVPELPLRAEGDRLTLKLPADSEERLPLTLSDLYAEARELKRAGITLELEMG